MDKRNIQNKEVKRLGKNPMVSILIPVYNGSFFIEATVKSVLASSYKNIEVILVNDGSTDKSKKICNNLEKRFKRVRFFDFPSNGGMVRSLNFGIRIAKGKYIARINQDDLMVKERLKKQVEFLENHNDYVAVGGYIKLFTKENPKFDIIKFPLKDNEIRSSWLMLSPFADPSVMYLKRAYLNTSGYSQDMWPADDVHMWYQLGSVGKLANLPFVLTYVRWHRGAGSIKFHKIQMRKTMLVHLWASQHVAKPNIVTWIFWFGEFIAGIIFPPSINWFVYREIRKVMSISSQKAKGAIKKASQASFPSFAFLGQRQQ